MNNYQKRTYRYKFNNNQLGSTQTEANGVTNGNAVPDAHSFTNYVYNNDATCTVDGTKTAQCDYCKTATDTTADDEHKATGHSFDMENWMTDETNHWHAATCEHSEEKADVAAHADNDDDHLCDECAYVMSQCADENNDHKCDVCGYVMSECADNDNDHNCDVCGTKLTDCKDENNDHSCDVCGEKLSDCKDGDGDHNCNVCGKDMGAPITPTKPAFNPIKAVVKITAKVVAVVKTIEVIKVATVVKGILGLFR